jgi:hypothetical protein
MHPMVKGHNNKKGVLVKIKKHEGKLKKNEDKKRRLNSWKKGGYHKN